MAEQPPESFRWPYQHLALLQRRCPGCGALPAAELVDRGISQPLYFCAAETCPVWAWDPSKGEHMHNDDSKGGWE